MLRSHPRLRIALGVIAAIIAMPFILIMLIGRISKERR